MLREHQSPIGKLKQAYEIGDEILKSRRLRRRTKNLALIRDPVARGRERRRQNFSKYVGERFERIITDTLTSLNNNDELFYLFNYINLEDQTRTSANILELQMQRVQEIITVIEKRPGKYSKKVPLNKNNLYDKKTGEISQYTTTIGVKDDAKKLIDYLWGKRKIIYSDRSSTKVGRGVSIQAILNNTSVSSLDRLVNVIDNFNAKCLKEPSKMRIHRDRTTKLVQLHVYDEFPTRI